jgi:hypothetical protein
VDLAEQLQRRAEGVQARRGGGVLCEAGVQLGARGVDGDRGEVDRGAHVLGVLAGAVGEAGPLRGGAGEVGGELQRREVGVGVGTSALCASIHARPSR